jgi:uncharacterized protein (TIGR02231 family)
MVQKYLLVAVMLFIMLTSLHSEDRVVNTKSRIESVKIYQNQAKVVRTAAIILKKGENRVIIGGLPKLLYDWSVRGSLPGKFRGRIMSLEVEKKALIKKRREVIAKIERKLDDLREKDRMLIDELKNIRSQEKFLNSIMDFTKLTASKELVTRIPQVKVWDSTLNYVIKKRGALLLNKRRIERERESIGKKIQKSEFELSQIAGYSYFNNYQTLNKAMIQQRTEMNVQQYSNITNEYAKRDRLLRSPTEKIDVEKQVRVNIFSSVERTARMTLTYIVPNTYWNMLYDFRASRGKKIDLVIYANIYQKTEEDWRGIDLSLSTGAPVSAISPPVLSPWYLNITTPYKYKSAPRRSRRDYSMQKESKMSSAGEIVADKDEEEKVPETKISEKGPFFEAALPLKHTVISSSKYQKKYIKDYVLKERGKVKFYYQCTPARVRNSFLRVKTANTTSLPWLKGEAQIFLENQFMGKVTIPYTPPGKERDLAIGVESRITGKKEQVKKYEDTSGLFGGNRRILYTYRITVENRLKEKAEVSVLDGIPVSNNKKIKVELANLSLQFKSDEKTKKSTSFQRGIREWVMQMGPGKKIEITYDVVITFDKDIRIRGLR